MARARGFTLIELMIVIAVIAIILAIALPSYREQMKKSRRSDAKQVLMDYALREEKWRATNATYGSVTNIGGSSTMPSGNYTIGAITFAPAAGNCPGTATAISSNNSFVITATKAGSQASDNKCATLVFSNTCGTISKTSTPAGNSCW